MIENLADSSEKEQLTSLDSIIDVFYDILVAPIITFNALSNEHTIELSSLLSSFFIVILAALANSTTANLPSVSFPTIALNMLGSCIEKMLFWFVLGLFLFLLAAIFKKQVFLRSCFLVTGWAFVPLIFKGITTCFSNATEFGIILSWCVSIWFLFLELFAFNSVLKLGQFKTLGIILILPPCLFFAYFISMMFAGVMLSDGLF